MNILALDFGTKRIGIAYGEEETGIAFARSAILHSSDVFPTLQKYAENNAIDKILVGLPLLPSGDTTQETENAQQFADDLEDYLMQNNILVPVEYSDERFSTKTVRETNKLLGISEKKSKGDLDSYAARVFLQMYLDSL